MRQGLQTEAETRQIRTQMAAAIEACNTGGRCNRDVTMHKQHHQEKHKRKQQIVQQQWHQHRDNTTSRARRRAGPAEANRAKRLGRVHGADRKEKWKVVAIAMTRAKVLAATGRVVTTDGAAAEVAEAAVLVVAALGATGVPTTTTNAAALGINSSNSGKDIW